MDVKSFHYRIPTALPGRSCHAPIPTTAGPFGQNLSWLKEKAEYLGTCFEHQYAPNLSNDWDFNEEVWNKVDNSVLCSHTANSATSKLPMPAQFID